MKTRRLTWRTASVVLGIVVMALHWAADCACRGAGVDSVNHQGALETSRHPQAQAFLEACFFGDAATAKRLLDEGVPIESLDEFGRTGLMRAAWKGQTEVVKLLLDHGADPNAWQPENWQYTALIFAAWQGNPDVVKLLLDRGADPNARGGYRTTALMEATRKGYADIVKQLLDRGASVNAQDGYGRTALMHVCYYGGGEVPSRMGKLGKWIVDQVIDFIMGSRSPHRVEPRGEGGLGELRWKMGFGRAESAKSLIDRGTDLQARDLSNKTALGLAIRSGYKETAALLTARGAKE
jgi:uncharacterized protein